MKSIESVTQLENILKILYWDIATYMSSGSAESIGKEIANLTVIVNNII